MTSFWNVFQMFLRYIESEAWFFMHYTNHHSDSHTIYVMVFFHLEYFMPISTYHSMHFLKQGKILSWHLPFSTYTYWRYYRKTSNISCSWSIVCRRCSSYIFILDLIPVFNGLGKYNCKTRRETFKSKNLVRLLLEDIRYVEQLIKAKHHLSPETQEGD